MGGVVKVDKISLVPVSSRSSGMLRDDVVKVVKIFLVPVSSRSSGMLRDDVVKVVQRPLDDGLFFQGYDDLDDELRFNAGTTLFMTS